MRFPSGDHVTDQTSPAWPVYRNSSVPRYRGDRDWTIVGFLLISGVSEIVCSVEGATDGAEFCFVWSIGGKAGDMNDCNSCLTRSVLAGRLSSSISSIWVMKVAKLAGTAGTSDRKGGK